MIIDETRNGPDRIVKKESTYDYLCFGVRSTTGWAYLNDATQRMVLYTELNPPTQFRWNANLETVPQVLRPERISSNRSGELLIFKPPPSTDWTHMRSIKQWLRGVCGDHSNDTLTILRSIADLIISHVRALNANSACFNPYIAPCLLTLAPDDKTYMIGGAFDFDHSADFDYPQEIRPYVHPRYLEFRETSPHTFAPTKLPYLLPASMYYGFARMIWEAGTGGSAAESSADVEPGLMPSEWEEERAFLELCMSDHRWADDEFEACCHRMFPAQEDDRWGDPDDVGPIGGGQTVGESTVFSDGENWIPQSARTDSGNEVAAIEAKTASRGRRLLWPLLIFGVSWILLLGAVVAGVAYFKFDLTNPWELREARELIPDLRDSLTKEQELNANLKKQVRELEEDSRAAELQLLLREWCANATARSGVERRIDEISPDDLTLRYMQLLRRCNAAQSDAAWREDLERLKGDLDGVSASANLPFSKHDLMMLESIINHD